MFRTTIRPYSTKGPGFLSDLLARIEAIPETPVVKTGKKPAKASQSAPTQKRNDQIKIADHPLARFNNNSIKNNVKQSNAKKQGPRDNVRVSSARNTAPRPASGAARKPAQNSSRARLPKRVSKSTFDKSDESNKQPREMYKQLVYTPYKPQIENNFIHARSTKLNHTISGRVASVTKEILIESKYPYSLPKQVIDSAPKTKKNQFVLQQSSFSTEVSHETLKRKLNAAVKGQVVPINTQVESIGKGLQDHAKFVERNLMNNPTLDIVSRQRFYDAATGIKPVSSLVQGCHWIKN